MGICVKVLSAHGKLNTEWFGLFSGQTESEWNMANEKGRIVIEPEGAGFRASIADDKAVYGLGNTASDAVFDLIIRWSDYMQLEIVKPDGSVIPNSPRCVSRGERWCGHEKTRKKE